MVRARHQDSDLCPLPPAQSSPVDIDPRRVLLARFDRMACDSVRQDLAHAGRCSFGDIAGPGLPTAGFRVLRDRRISWDAPSLRVGDRALSADTDLVCTPLPLPNLPAHPFVRISSAEAAPVDARADHSGSGGYHRTRRMKGCAACQTKAPPLRAVSRLDAALLAGRWSVMLAGRLGMGSRRRDCHSAAPPPSAFRRWFTVDGEGMSVK